MKETPHPLALTFTGFAGNIAKQADRMGGFEKWFFNKEDKQFFDIPEKFPLSNMVYLSPDSSVPMRNICIIPASADPIPCL